MVAEDDGLHLVEPAELDRSTTRLVADNQRSDLILVVDDDKVKRMALKAALMPLGLSVVEADSGVAALRILMDQQFAVILLDVFMPSMNGFETASFIRQRQQSEMTPIIFITAFGSDEIAEADRFAEGAVDFIFAPVDPTELRAKVTYFVNLFRKAEQLATRTLELEMSADHLRLLTDVAPIGIFQTDADNRYIYTNPRWSALTGIAAETAKGQQLDTVIATELRSGLMGQLNDPRMHRDEFLPIQDTESRSRPSHCLDDGRGHPKRRRWDRRLDRYGRRCHSRSRGGSGHGQGQGCSGPRPELCSARAATRLAGGSSGRGRASTVSRGS